MYDYEVILFSIFPAVFRECFFQIMLFMNCVTCERRAGGKLLKDIIFRENKFIKKDSRVERFSQEVESWSLIYSRCELIAKVLKK